MRIITRLMAAILCTALISGCTTASSSSVATTSIPVDTSISFTDDEGREIKLTQPCKKIISLYSAHTENLFDLGVGDSVLGVHSTSTYPAQAAFIPRFDYNGDPETVIAAEPDCVLIRPFITRKSPDFVKALENAGILVVALYPEGFDEFEGYITRLGMLTGTEDTAAKKLLELNAKLLEIKILTAKSDVKPNVFFEATKENIRTVTKDSMPALAIRLAGGSNIAGEIKPTSEGGTIGTFGAEQLLSNGDELDVYISQRGAMNAGGTVEEISSRPGFDTIKAVKNGKVFVIDEKLISSPTFRFYKGVHEVARYIHPEMLDDLSKYNTDTPATKRDLANIIVMSQHLPIYIPTSSKYYEQEHKGHIYGLFEDVSWNDPDYDYIETAVNTGAIQWKTNEADSKQYFNPDESVTSEMLANSLEVIMGENKPANIDVQGAITCGDIVKLFESANANK